MPSVTNTQVVLPSATLRKLRNLTAVNNHSEAYRTAAAALGLPDLTARFDRIARAQTAAGELTAAFYAERRAAYEELMDRAKALLSPRQYRALYARF